MTTDMTWNHRVVRVPDGDEHILLLCEVFYDNGKPVGRNEGARVFGNDINEMWSVMGRMRLALCLPILDDFDAGVEAQDTDGGKKVEVPPTVGRLMELIVTTPPRAMWTERQRHLDEIQGLLTDLVRGKELDNA